MRVLQVTRAIVYQARDTSRVDGVRVSAGWGLWGGVFALLPVPVVVDLSTGTRRYEWEETFIYRTVTKPHNPHPHTFIATRLSTTGLQPIPLVDNMLVAPCRSVVRSPRALGVR